jgi:hypothetical protein
LEGVPGVLSDTPGIDILVGMDILGLGDFAVTHHQEDDRAGRHLLSAFRRAMKSPPWRRIALP